MKLNRVALFFSLAVGFSTLVGSPGKANAATTVTCDGGMSYVDFQQVSSTNTRLGFGCWANGVQQSFNMYTGVAGTCSSYNVTLEVLKGFKASAEAALMSGKQVIITYDVCSYIPIATTFSIRR